MVTSVTPDVDVTQTAAVLDNVHLTENTQHTYTCLYPSRFPPNAAYPSARDFEVKRYDDQVGMGVISYRAFEPGERVAAINGDRLDTVLQHTLQIRPGVHNFDPWFSGFFLHSCEPNIEVDMQAMEARCLRSIAPNDWLYMDYAQTEDELFACFQCSCGSANCRRVITGKKQSVAEVAPSVLWWKRERLSYQDNDLTFAGRSVNALAQQHGTPTFVYDGARVVSNSERLTSALDEAGLEGRHRVMYAMKANRFEPLLTYLLATGTVGGLDVCSPDEVESAMGCGYRADQLSFTATSLSRTDIERISKIQGLLVNLDSLSALRRWGANPACGRDIGLRINPAQGVGRSDNELMQYSGDASVTKFGIYQEQFAEALAIAAEYGLRITRIHFHVGCGYLTPQLAAFGGILDECLRFIDRVPTCETVIVGGGLGVPYTAEDEPLDLHAWASLLAHRFRDRKFDVWLEPGSYLVQDAGLLLTTANSVEQKATKMFVGTDAGFNLAPEPANYALPFQPIPATWKPTRPTQTLSIVGNINEAHDVWFEDIELPQVDEDDVIALYNAGAYSSSMASNHCLRGGFKEFLLL